MSSFEDKIFETIKTYHMIENGDTVVVGVSGGADSVCLLLCLSLLREKLDYQLLAVHVEHGIRGEESLEDARFTEELCSCLNVPCRVYHEDIPAMAREKGQSLEEAARNFRYNMFRKELARMQDLCASENSAVHGRIAVAHNLGDQAETVLHNLVRGTGLLGLGGMKPVQGEIIRPLLFTGREEIEAWLLGKGMTWKCDRTNLETTYTRNRIRHLILPELDNVNEHAREHICEAAMRAAAADAYLQKQAEQWCHDRIKTEPLSGYEDGKIGCQLGLDGYTELEEILQEYILRCAIGQVLQKKGMKDISAVHVEALKKLANGPCGKMADLPGGMTVYKEAELLRFSVPEKKIRHTGNRTPEIADPGSTEDEVRISEDEVRILENEVRISREEIPLDGPAKEVDFGGHRFTFQRMSRASFEASGIDLAEEKKYTKWLTYDTIRKELCLRTRRTGDMICVNRTGGRKKLKDFMIDRKIPAGMRDEIPLITDGNRVLWMVGYRLAADAGVFEKTFEIVRIEREE